MDSLRVEKKKNDLLLVQVEAFKQEYRSRISAYKKKMKKLVALQQRQQGEDRSLTLEEDAVTADGGVSSSGELKKLSDLERIIKELLGKIKEVRVLALIYCKVAVTVLLLCFICLFLLCIAAVEKGQ